MIKLIAFVIIGMAIFGTFYYFNHKQDIKFCDSSVLESGKNSEVVCYQGPVRPTDNEEYFRATGKTIPLEVKE